MLKAGSILVGVSFLFGYLWLAIGETWMLDNKVRELCKKDGGIEIYEKVYLPKELIDKHGRIQIPYEKDSKPNGPYYYETIKHYYRKGDPEVSRREYRIVRRKDKKILGRLVIYGRGGGGLPGPWHGSSFTCPERSKVANFESQVFILGNNNE